jgi:hypothetical protein
MVLFKIVFSFLIFTQAKATRWMVKTSLDSKSISLTNTSNIEFSYKDKVLTYSPSILEFGVSKIKRVRFNNKDYFVTVWAKGARFYQFRVFKPLKTMSEKIAPLCEYSSVSSSFELFKKSKKVGIEILKFDEALKKYDPAWMECAYLMFSLLVFLSISTMFSMSSSSEKSP